MVGPGIDLDPQLGALLGESTTDIDVARKNRVFCNRNLRMDGIEMIGFDMDYTLALYHQDKLEELSIELTLKKLVEKHAYPDEIRGLRYDPGWAIRGSWSTAPPATSSRWTGTRTSAAATTASASSPTTSGARATATRRSTCRATATSGSTRCSRCPRRSCT